MMKIYRDSHSLAVLNWRTLAGEAELLRGLSGQLEADAHIVPK